MKRIIVTSLVVSGVLLFIGRGGAFAANLGAAANFSVLSTGGSVTLGGTAVNGGEVGGINAVLSGGSSVSADLIASDSVVSDSGIRATNTSTITNQCVTGGSQVQLLTGSTCGVIDISGGNPLLGTMATADANALSFSRSQQNKTPNQFFGSVNIPTNSATQINTSVPGGTTIVDMADLEIGKTGGNGSLIINGAAGDYILFNIFGNFYMFGNSSITLTGGITPDHVVFNVICSGTSVETVSQGPVVINGTIVAVGRRCDLGSATLNGQIICGANVSMNPTSTVNFMPLGNLP